MIHHHNKIHKIEVNSYLDSRDNSSSLMISAVENSLLEYPQDILLISRRNGILSRGLYHWVTQVDYCLLFIENE